MKYIQPKLENDQYEQLTKTGQKSTPEDAMEITEYLIDARKIDI